MLTQIKTQAAMLKNLLAAGGLLAGGYLLATLGWSFNLPTLVIRERIPESNRNPVCSEIVQPKAVLSREQLAQLMTVPERSARRKVQEIIKEPYCRLPSLSIRVGATTEREIYPLAFEPQTSLVILYEGETFVGYGFKKS
ncbi:hypothetical protein H6F77_16860 [Microcoleus sp. FACHB-831]|jgi:hypothetical protein|uniref:hypothetical protein n=1 Tax=Microcoleus sp. FACHB-831 TaxID=2692827 RepID=UPI0016865448|nr:hypothetical protein [Microcoleus sp. FACHB-831]MBD1922727.1 hypothetical protein [Microcoleus sp. FACHB-831]